MSTNTLQKWHEFVKAPELDALNGMLAEDAVFHSPVVHTPQQGKAIVSLYLAAAGEVLLQSAFEYVGEWQSEDGAVLEFKAEVDGIIINGVDMIRWNDEGKIVEFKVMIRPLKAVNLLHQKMKAMLESMQ